MLRVPIDRPEVRTAQILRSARKYRSLTQVFISKSIGVSQGTISKFEKGILIPSAPQWFDLCRHLKIPADSFETGRIESLERIKMREGPVEGGFALPSKYRGARGSSVRSGIPILMYGKAVLGDAKLEKLKESMGFDPDFFNILGNQVPLRFYIDLLDKISRHSGKTQNESINELMPYVSLPQSHGRLSQYYEDAPEVAARFERLVEHSRFYECNFHYSCESSHGKLEIVAKPEEHLDFSSLEQADVGTLLCEYKASYFRNFAKYRGAGTKEVKSSVREVECFFKGSEKCVFQVQVA